jgi:hypothetical protein
VRGARWRFLLLALQKLRIGKIVSVRIVTTKAEATREGEVATGPIELVPLTDIGDSAIVI